MQRFGLSTSTFVKAERIKKFKSKCADERSVKVMLYLTIKFTPILEFAQTEQLPCVTVPFMSDKTYDEQQLDEPTWQIRNCQHWY